MLFNSQAFILLFLPVVLGLYYALANHAVARRVMLVIASMGFYAWWDPRFVPVLAALTVANWLVARWFGRSGGRWLLVAGIIGNLAVLGLFKYADFLRGTVFDLAGQPWQPWSLILPLGISFFVFQKIAYLADLRRGDRHIYGFLDFALFVGFFPQLVAGPLVRHNEIIHQFAANPRGPALWENLGRGFTLFVIGVTKKVAIADTIAPAIDPLFTKALTTSLTGAEAWTAALGYTLQIYFDFSGYSDMAIGLALLFGFRLPLNFDAPYRAVSIRDFWRRWHMTLSRFLRDYLYVPLGGNRQGAVRQVANVVLTMLLGGLWHGAAWTFVVWGGLHGLALAVAHGWERARLPMPAALGWLLTLLFVIACWVLFRAADFSTAADILASMTLTRGWGDVAPHREALAAMLIGGVMALIGPTSQDAALRLLRPTPWVAVVIGLGLTYLTLLIGGRLPNVFIYFQF
jgi:D-alanyl-lipoteichoic acid acyltransferase DltB (MBOAT superfamily)